LSLVDCVAIGINGIIGSGIYLRIAPMAQTAGYAAVVGTVACSLICILIALCFAELGGMYDRNGGSYVYAREAFGSLAGYAVGWMSTATGVLSFAAVAAGFGEALVTWMPSLANPVFTVGGFTLVGKTAASALLIAVLGGVNYFGVKAGARISDFLSFTKLLPLLLLAGVGVFFIRGEVLAGMFSTASIPTQAPASGGTSWFSAVANSAFIAVFMLSGFEYTAVPAGETQDARRNIPRSIVGSLIGSAILYAVLQLVAASAVPDLGTREQPLMDTARAVLGNWGASFLGIAAVISMAGFCAGSALVGPRYFTALADDGYLPARLSAMTRHQTPGPAILLSSVLSIALTLFLGYTSLADVSTVALFAQYIPTTLAVIALRRRQPDAPRVYKLPGGPVIPLVATAASVVLLWSAKPQPAEWILSGQIFGLGLLFWGATLWHRRRSSRAVAVPR
jgi:amino acid transporter